MIDLHTHSLLSDGELLPSELVRRAENNGYTAIGITDHADISNIDFVIPRIVKFCQWINNYKRILTIPGIELTHIPLEGIHDMTLKARELGAVLIIVHGETLSEPVLPGTNLAALESDIDILAHPGLLSAREAQIAANRNIFLEISTRKGHSLANGHVVKMAQRFGAKLVINTDAHSPGDIVTLDNAIKIAQGAGLEGTQIDSLMSNADQIVGKAIEILKMKGFKNEN